MEIALYDPAGDWAAKGVLLVSPIRRAIQLEAVLRAGTLGGGATKFSLRRLQILQGGDASGMQLFDARQILLGECMVLLRFARLALRYAELRRPDDCQGLRRLDAVSHPSVDRDHPPRQRR